MNYRSDLIMPAQAMAAASGTLTIDIKVKQPISRLEMTYKTTKTKQGMDAPAPSNIPKFELVDGSTPLHSLCGFTNQALAYYNRHGVAMEHGQHINASSELDIYAMDFGRFLHDPFLAFDPSRFKNPQLKISWNRALADTGVTVDSMEIWAELFDEKLPTPQGFLSAREIWSGNFLADNSVNEIMLPEDEVIRQILVRANYAGYEPWYQVDIAKLDEASNGHVIFEYLDLEMYYRRMKSRWPMLQVPFEGFADPTGRIFYIPATDYWATILAIGNQGTTTLFTDSQSMKGGKATLKASGSVNIQGHSFGYLPWHTFQFPMGRQSDIDDWYSPAGKKPRLRLTSNTAGANGDGNVVIETIHRY